MPTRKEVVQAAQSKPDRRKGYDTKLAALQAAIDEGDASGIAKGDVLKRVRERLKLPKTLR